ncbi:MAG: TIM barrel protein [Clostridia bacterium]|nr:TIM barrel protein [Clostridia bacterium]
MEAGINLYSLRTLIGDEEGFLNTANELRRVGYSSIQYSGAPYDPERIGRVSRKSGLPVVLTHVPMDRILNDTDALMSEHESFGCRIIGLGAMPPATVADPEAFRRTVDALDRAGRYMKERGFEFSYHHHHFEMFRINGSTALGYMIENAPDINITVDTYWLQYGGADVISTIDRLSGRVKCIHLKDYRVNAAKNAEGAVSFAPGFAPVGEGVLDFAAITEHAKAAGTVHFLVEQDDAVNYPDPLAQVKSSIDYIKENL